MNISKKDIQLYLDKVRNLVVKDRYRMEKNKNRKENVRLLKKIGNESNIVHLYIKLNMLSDCFVIVVSFHEQKYPMKYYFKKEAREI